ncbi:FecR domain-containing protein, partial [Candidatus Pelagibacter ubique]|nr:FecR domain-containing protein [Candidatus Pelagibacter ubique]
MKKNNIFHMRYINTAFKKIYLLLILTSLFFLISINITHSEEKIGSIVSIKNEVFAINADGEKRLLDLYDEILLQDKIVTNELSTATVQYNDNSTIIIKKSSSFKVTDFNITGVKNIFLGEVQKGSVIIESGKIAKDDNGSMVIELPKMTLGIKGTRFNIENKPDGTSAVSLAEDSFGNVGIINISSEGKVKTLFDTEQVVSTNTETGFSERVKTDDEKKELVDASNDLIEASSIDENIIQKNLEEKLLNGSLLDANGDGVIDTLDVEVIKETIKLEKQEKIDFIVDNSTGENTEFLSQVLNKSDEASIGDSINKIFEINNDLVASVITNLSNEDNTFLTTSNSEANNAIKEKIYTQMLSNSANVETIGKIISKSDGATIEKMINIVSLSDTNDLNSNLSLQVLSSVADANAARAATDPAGLNTTFLNTGGQSEVNKLIESAVANAGNNPESSKMLANVITKSDAGSISLMINRIQTVSESNPNSNLSLQVLSSVADANAARAATDPAGLNTTFLNTGGQSEVNKLIESAVANAGNNPESSKMLANVITKSDAATVGTMLNNIATVSSKDSNSTLAAQVLSSVAITAADSTTSVNTELKDKVNFFIDTVTKTSEAAATAAEEEAAEEAAATAAEEDAAEKAA